jgi:cytochrome c peroxidase
LHYLKILVIVLAVVLSAAVIGPQQGRKPVDESFSYVKSETQLFSRSVHELNLAIDHINPTDLHSIQPAIRALKSCRIQYKKISFFLDYFYPQQGKLFNAPAKTEVEEPFMEVEEPQSLQQIEAILFAPGSQFRKPALHNLILVLDESAADLIPLYAGFDGTAAQMLESLHLELIRVMALYITGYDAPDLKTGVMESRSALESIQTLIDIFFYKSKTETNKLDSLLTGANGFTRTADFNHFDRLTFLTHYALPIEEQLEQCIRIHDLQLSTTPILNYNAENLFRGEIKQDIPLSSIEKVEIGRALFSEKALSGDGSRSCATCHRPDKYFTDGLIANRKINSDSLLRRNTPTLLYSACQSAEFWDGRAGSLSEQIRSVLTSPDEMNASLSEIEKRLSWDKSYRSAFHDSVNIGQIEGALIAYLNTLQPLNSAFDYYMMGNKNAMTAPQKRGFNLFMGKAQCGSCHFAPMFNGSTPPFYNRSEYEVLGIPGTQSSVAISVDRDLGRYERYPISVYRRAFKTPTIRNVEMTGPYMHNGYFKTLRSVIEFYNKGGGIGIGLANAGQSLSKKPLHLSNAEIKDIIAFLESLTDKQVTWLASNQATQSK